MASGQQRMADKKRPLTGGYRSRCGVSRDARAQPRRRVMVMPHLTHTQAARFKRCYRQRYDPPVRGGEISSEETDDTMSVTIAGKNAVGGRSAAVFAALVAAATMTAPVMAQDAAPGSGAGVPDGWYKACTKQAENDVCVVQNIEAAGNGQLLTAVGLITVTGEVNQKVMQVSVPSARMIQPGIQMQVDDNQPQRLEYAVCMPDKCVAEVPLTDQMINQFKGGAQVTFTSVNFQRAQNPIEISLQGFTDAFEGEAMAQSELEERQRALQEQMQRKAQEARARLEEAQEKAKSQ